MSRTRLPSSWRMLAEFTILFLVVVCWFPVLKGKIDPYWPEMAGHFHERSQMCDAVARQCAPTLPKLADALRVLAVEYEDQVWPCRYGLSLDRRTASRISNRLMVRELVVLHALEVLESKPLKQAGRAEVASSPTPEPRRGLDPAHRKW